MCGARLDHLAESRVAETGREAVCYAPIPRLDSKVVRGLPLVVLLLWVGSTAVTMEIVSLCCQSKFMQTFCILFILL